MTEYFYTLRTFGAPFVGDDLNGYVEAESSSDAVNKVIAECTHPSGVFSLNIYADADAYHKELAPLAIWRSEKALKQGVR